MAIFLGLAGLLAGVTLENEMADQDTISVTLISREEALKKLLQPITWSPRSSIPHRQNHVTNIRKEVLLVFPFLMNDEKLKALEWLDREKHEDLWD